MKIIIVGPQGSGKGTHSKIISKELGIPHISTGDLLRGTTGKLKEKVDSLINEGNLVSDELILEILKARINQGDCEEGFILDGFPRNRAQAELLRGITSVDKVVELKAGDDFVIERISNRLSCKCGSTFNSKGLPPKVAGICDDCEGELYTRKDDKPEAIKKRLENYRSDTAPILELFDKIEINAERERDDISKDILDSLANR